MNYRKKYKSKYLALKGGAASGSLPKKLHILI